MPFELYTEEVYSGDARSFALLTHGVLGAGRNLRSLAKAVVDRCPQRGILLADLREHGRSMGATPPHTMAAAAADLCSLVETKSAQGMHIDALIGHSLGGKAVLLARRQLAVSQTWVLDSSLSIMQPPYAASETMRVIDMLESLPASGYAKREDFVQQIEDRGFSRPLAMWLATNLEEESAGGYRFARDMAAIRSLIESYFEIDGWSLLDPREDEEIHLVLGLRSTNHSPGDRERMAALDRENPRISVHELDAGHWLHAERKDELADLLARYLPSR